MTSRLSPDYREAGPYAGSAPAVHGLETPARGAAPLCSKIEKMRVTGQRRGAGVLGRPGRLAAATVS